MRTRAHRSEDHSHPDQSNVDPTAPLAPLFDEKLLPAPQHEHRAQALREAWEPRNMVPTPTSQEIL